MDKINKVLLVLNLLLVVTLSGCKTSDYEILSTPISFINLEKEGHIEQLHDYDSPYTICYKNKDDTYTIYIFSSPVQFKTEKGYNIIDNTVIGSSYQNFVFENKANSIKTYFPMTLDDEFLVKDGNNHISFSVNEDVKDFSEAKVKEYINMYGDKVTAVVYESSNIDMVFYPTRTGIRVEMVLRKQLNQEIFSYSVKTSGNIYENKQNGYILFKNGDKNTSIIYAPLIKGSKNNENNFNIESQLDISKQEDGYLVNLNIDDNVLNNNKIVHPVYFDLSFELYLSKIPDTSVYSNFNINSYLQRYAVIGTHPTFGEGWEYVRFRLNYFIEQSCTKVNSAEYITKKINHINTRGNINVSIPNEQWSSSQIIWNTQIDFTESLNYKISENNSLLSINITDFVKECIFDNTSLSESIGIVLSSKLKEKYIVLATAEDSLYSTCLKLHLSDLPYEFTERTSVNESLF